MFDIKHANLTQPFSMVTSSLFMLCTEYSFTVIGYSLILAYYISFVTEV